MNKLFKMIEEMEEKNKRMNTFLHNKKIGYEPKCKVCNSQYQDIIERSREEGATLEDMKDYLEDKGETISLMSLSRHFDRHYPSRKRYLQGLDEEKSREIKEGEDTINWILEDHPEFKEILEEDQDHGYYDDNGEIVWTKKKGRDVFIFDYGYCSTKGMLCNKVPKGNYYTGSEASFDLKNELDNLIDGSRSDYMDREKFRVMRRLLQCMDCQASNNHYIMEGLLNLVIYHIYGVRMESEEFYQIINSLDVYPEKVDKELQEYASRELKKVKDKP